MKHWRDILGALPETEHAPPIPPHPPKRREPDRSGGTGGIGGLGPHSVTPDAARFEERAAILQFEAVLSRCEAEARAARELGFADAHDYRATLCQSWKQSLRRLDNSKLPRSSSRYARTAIAFIDDGWAMAALVAGWQEAELVWADERAPWARLDNLGAAFLCRHVQSVNGETIVCAVQGGRPLIYRRMRGDGRVTPPWLAAMTAFENATRARHEVLER